MSCTAATDQRREQNSREHWSSKLGGKACMHAKQQKSIMMVASVKTLNAPIQHAALALLSQR